MIKLVRQHRFVISVVGAIFLFVFSAGGLVVANGETIEPNDVRVVSLYMDGQDLDIPTRAKTVGEFIRNAELDVGEYDLVEPDADEEISSDQFRIRVLRARPYTIREGSRSSVVLSAHTSPRMITEAAGLSLHPKDSVEFAPLDITDAESIGRVITLTRSKAIQLVLYGSPQTIHTNASNVRQLLDELGVAPAPDDEVQPAFDTVISEGLVVAVNRNGIKIVTEEVSIDPPVEYVTDNDLTLGSSVVRDPGSPGKKVVTYEIITQNEAEVSRKELSSVVVEQPRTKVIARGRAAGQIGEERMQLMALAGLQPEEYAAADYIISRESGWCALKWQGQWGYCPSFYEEPYAGAESDRSRGYGLCQSTPAIKMASAGEDWRTNAVTQLKWCTSYARGRYGDWNKAFDFWIANKWW